MARQVAALTRNSSYRYSPTPIKDSSFYGINHNPPSTTSSVCLSGQLNTPDLSAFKTPPEGNTPVDQKNFNFDDGTLRSLQAVHNLSWPLFDKLNDSGTNQNNATNEEIKTNEDDVYEFHTPPEFHVEDNSDSHAPFGYPPEYHELLNSVIKLLPAQDCSMDEKIITENTAEDTNERLTEFHELSESEVLNTQDGHLTLTVESVVNSEHDSTDKDSYDGSPQSRQSFTQEEDDSGISIVDENDIVPESTARIPENTNDNDIKMTTFEKNASNTEESIEETKSKCNDVYRSELNTCCEQETEIDSKCSTLRRNSLENEYLSSTGWQTRQKKMSRRRHDKMYNNRIATTESPTRDGRDKDSVTRRLPTKNKRGESYNKDRKTEERRSEDGRKTDIVSTQERRRRGQTGKKSDSKYMKNHKERNNECGKHNEVIVQKAKPQQGNTFSYRDALLKAGETKVANPKKQTAYLSQHEMTFDLESTANYLSSVWNSVNNLHRQDPSKVYIYNDD